MEATFTGWDRGFNVMILRMAELTAGAYTVGPDAPETLEALNSFVEKHKAIHVSDTHSDQTVYGSAEVNFAARTWHDWSHWRIQAPFTPEGEKLVYERQLTDMIKVYRLSADTLRWAQMLYAEVVGQTEYKERWGVFPVNQIAFDLAYLINPAQAVELGLYHPLQIDTQADEARAAKIHHGIG